MRGRHALRIHSVSARVVRQLWRGATVQRKGGTAETSQNCLDQHEQCLTLKLYGYVVELTIVKN
jgi:hypothetical protein